MCAASRLLSVDMKWYITRQVEDDILDDEIIKQDKYQAAHGVVNT